MVLPQVFGNGDDGGPVIDSYEEMIQSLVGGQECLDPSWQNENSKDCCDQFAENITGQDTSLGSDVLAKGRELFADNDAAVAAIEGFVVHRDIERFAPCDEAPCPVLQVVLVLISTVDVRGGQALQRLGSTGLQGGATVHVG